MPAGERQCRICKVRGALERDDEGILKYCLECYARLKAKPFLERVKAIATKGGAR